jgi:hypothetical protein
MQTIVKESKPFVLDTSKYVGVQNVGENTYIYSHANVYPAHGTIMPHKNGEYVLESHPEWLERIDESVTSSRINRLIEQAVQNGLIEDMESKEQVEAVFLHRVFAMYDDSEDNSDVEGSANVEIVPAAPKRSTARTNAVSVKATATKSNKRGQK